MTPLEPIPTLVQSLTENLFGVAVADPFRWLEDAEAPQVVSWMQAHDARARSYLAALPERAQLSQRLSELLYIEQRSIPTKYGGRYFFSVKPATKEKQIYYVQEGKSGAPRVLLDANVLSADGSLSIGSVTPSYDGRFALYLEHPNNADAATLRVLDVASGALQERDVIEELRYTSPSWARDNSGFYYLWMPRDDSIPPQERVAHAEIRFHRLGDDPAKDVMIFPKTGNASQFLYADVSYDGTLLFVFKSEGWSKNEVFVRDLKRGGAFRPLTQGKEALYAVSAFGGRLFIRTNEDAPRYRLFVTDAEHLGREHWRELVAEHPSAVLQGASVVGRHLVLQFLKDAQTQLEVRTLDGALVRNVNLPALGTASSLIGDEEDNEAYFEFSSFTYAREIYEVDVASGQQTLHYRTAVPATPAQFEVRQEWFLSKDGTRIPMFIVHSRDLVLNGKNPTLLTGYGGFNQTMLPSFMSTLYPWLEAGGVFALPNLRGGGEYGAAWHEAGMLQNKQNVFDDFIAAAEHLIEKGYTSPQHLGISGRSNGGLLVGAVMTQRPDLFGAVLCGVPLLDMLRYHLSGLGSAWVPEYGDPEKEQDFRVLHAYSPYHQLKEGVVYPPLLMLSADADDRVDPLHARKFVARLSTLGGTNTGAANKVLLRIEQNAGHGGADLRRQLIERSADEYAFLLSELAP